MKAFLNLLFSFGAFCLVGNFISAAAVTINVEGQTAVRSSVEAVNVFSPMDSFRVSTDDITDDTPTSV